MTPTQPVESKQTSSPGGLIQSAATGSGRVVWYHPRALKTGSSVGA
jgi:hypothetical protein